MTGPRPDRRSARSPLDLVAPRAPSRLGGALYLLVLAAIAFYDLGGRSIFHRDVTRFATIAAEMLRSGDWLVPTHYGDVYANKPILYIWGVATVGAVVGEPGALALRIPSALALVATGWATCLWGRARSGSVAVGRLAGLVAVTTFSLHELGRTGRPDMLSTAFATVAAALVDRALLGLSGRRAFVGIGLALGGGLLSKGPVVLLVPAALVLLPRPGTTLLSRHRLVRPDLALGLGVLLCALWIVPAGLHGGWTYVRRLAFDQVGDRLRGEAKHRAAAWYYVQAAPLAWLPWSPAYAAAVCAVAFRRARAAVGSLSHVGATFAALVALSIVPTKEIRYAAIFVPPLAVLVAQLASAWARGSSDDDRPSGARIHLRLAGAAAILATGAIVFAQLRWTATIAWLAPLALVALGTGVSAIRSACSPISTREVRGGFIGVLVCLAACGIASYWVVLGRYLPVHEATAENEALARAIDPGTPTILVGSNASDGLAPDDFVSSALAVRFIRSAEALDAADLPPGVQVIALARDRLPIEARMGPSVRVLDRPRPDGQRLVVLRRAPQVLFGEPRPADLRR